MDMKLMMNFSSQSTGHINTFMEKKMNDLSDVMQERLKKWRENALVVPSTEKMRGNNYVSRRDYGDDLRDFQEKDAKAWQRELENNPQYR